MPGSTTRDRSLQCRRRKHPPRKRLARSKERLHGSIARELGVAIVAGRIKPGETLDNEVDSSEQMSVSRTAYREAVRILAAKGLVASRPKRGTQVCPKERLASAGSRGAVVVFRKPAEPGFRRGLVRAASDRRARGGRAGGGAPHARGSRADARRAATNGAARARRPPTGRAPTATFTTPSWPPRAIPRSWRSPAASAPPCGGRRSSSNASANCRATRAGSLARVRRHRGGRSPTPRGSRCRTSSRSRWRTPGSR